MEKSSFTAQELIAVMKAAAETGVLSMDIGDIHFTRTGFVARATVESRLAAAVEEAQAAQDWADAAPPADALAEAF